MKHIYVTEYTYLYPSQGIARIELKYTSCDGPITDDIGYGDVLTGNLIAQLDLQYTINHRVTLQLVPLEVRWYDESSYTGVTEDGYRFYSKRIPNQNYYYVFDEPWACLFS